MSIGYKAIYRGGLLAEYQDGVLINGGDGGLSNKITGPQIIRDIDPYKSMVTGEMITSRTRHRDHLKRHNVTEVGNDTSHMKKAPQTQSQDRKRLLASQLADKSDKQISQMIRAEIDRRRG